MGNDRYKNYYGIIYKAKSNTENKNYIGATIKKLYKRKSDHLAAARGNFDNQLFHTKIRELGRNDFSWLVLAYCNNKEELANKEIEFQKLYQSHINEYGYNIKLGSRPSQLMAQNISKRTTGKLNPMYGRKFSEESRRKISAGLLKFYAEKRKNKA